MKLLSLACAAVVLAFPLLASAESLRCERGIAAEGDSRLALTYKCGQPKLIDTYCAPVFVYSAGTLQLVPEPYALAVVPCQQVEEWLYERGPGELLATVRMRSGVVQSIHYGRYPR
jgi:hypothetical protein